MIKSSLLIHSEKEAAEEKMISSHIEMETTQFFGGLLNWPGGYDSCSASV